MHTRHCILLSHFVSWRFTAEYYQKLETFKKKSAPCTLYQLPFIRKDLWKLDQRVSLNKSVNRYLNNVVLCRYNCSDSNNYRLNIHGKLFIYFRFDSCALSETNSLLLFWLLPSISYFWVYLPCHEHFVVFFSWKESWDC